MIGRVLRSIALVSAVATAMTPGLLAVAEGIIEATATAPSAHIEAAGGSESCPVAHDAHCAACSMLRHGYTGPADAPALRLPAGSADGLPRHGVLAAESRLHGSAIPRAPPAA